MKIFGKNGKIPWLDTRLSKEEMNFLNHAIVLSIERQKSEEDWKENTGGNISRSELIDKNDWFYKTVLNKLIEKMFYDDWDNYCKYHVVKEEPPPKFEMDRFWVNYMKQHDHIPLHDHGALFSFVIFMKIPTHWKEQHGKWRQQERQFYTYESASDFQFVWVNQDAETCITTNFPLSSEDEGRMFFFPAWLKHQVYPFYKCEEERITISGNINFIEQRSERKEGLAIEMGGKEQMLKIMEEQITAIKADLLKEQLENENENQ